MMSGQPSEDLAGAARGVVYSCAGERYATEALRSARSSLRHNAVPHLLFVSADCAGEAEKAAEAEAGLVVRRFEPSDNPYADKVSNMRRSPFTRTIYLDTDTIVVDEIVHLLLLLDHFELAVAHDASRRGAADPRLPAAFCEFNTGVIAWRASEQIDEFMRSWQSTYSAWLQNEPFAGAARASARRQARRPRATATSWGGAADQPAFRRCAWEHDVRLFVLAPEYNLRLGEPATVVDRVRVIHGRHPDIEGLAAQINARTGPRSWPQPLSLRARAVRGVRRKLRGSSG
jgi:hypothetical protein